MTIEKGDYPQTWLKLQGAISTEKGWKHPDRKEILKCLKGANIKYPSLANLIDVDDTPNGFKYILSPANEVEENLIHNNPVNIDVQFASLYSLDDSIDYKFVNNTHRIEFDFNSANGVKQVPLGFKVDQEYIDYINSQITDKKIISLQYDYYNKSSNTLVANTAFGAVSGVINDINKSLLNITSNGNEFYITNNMYVIPVDELNELYTKITMRLYSETGDIVGQYVIDIVCNNMIL